MTNIRRLLFFVSLSVCSLSFAAELPATPPSPPVVDQRRQTSERFGFVVRSGNNLSKGTKAWKIVRFVRLFYVGYAISHAAPKDIRAEVFRRSMGNNNAAWSDIWNAAKDMAKQVEGTGDGTVDLLFAPIEGLEDPEKQYNRMMSDPDYIPCSDVVLGALLAQLDSAGSAASFNGRTSTGTGGEMSNADSTAGTASAENGMSMMEDGRPSDKALENPQTAMAYLQSLLDARLRNEVDNEYWLRETRRTEEIVDRVNGVTPEQKKERAAKSAQRVKQLSKTITCRDCRGTGYGPPIRGTSAPRFAGAGDDVRLEYCKACGGIATTDHSHKLCNACHGLGKRRPFLNEIDEE